MDVSYVTGNGEKAFKNPHLRPTAVDDIEEPWPGLVSGGPNVGLQDERAKEVPAGSAPMKCYLDHIDCYFGIAGLSGLKTDYATTFNCDYTANWYITEQYLKTRMSAGGAIMYVSSTAGLNWMKYRKEEEKVISSSSWDAVQEAIAHLEKSSPSTFAYIFAKRCISYYAARLSTELGKKGIRVNTVLPGSTDTGMKSEFQKMAGGEQALLKEAGAAGRLATSLEMAWPIVFVNSAGASFVSGLELNVDYADTQMKELKLKKDIEDIPVTNPLVLAAAKRAMSRKA